MRRLALPALAVAAVLVGCSSEPDTAPSVAEGGEHIPCALDGATEFASSCAVDRAQVDGKLTLIVRHPDGAFRRFAVVTDGRGLAVADGAEQAVSTMQGDKLAVTVADDRYLFPAKVKSAQGNAS
jgi:hypothetical protein